MGPEPSVTRRWSLVTMHQARSSHVAGCPQRKPEIASELGRSALEREVRGEIKAEAHACESSANPLLRLLRSSSGRTRGS